MASEKIEVVDLTAAQRKAQRQRSIAIALALGVFVVVMFAVTVIKMGPAIMARPL